MQRVFQYDLVSGYLQDVYAWSAAANWANGGPVDGDSVLDDTVVPGGAGAQIFFGPAMDDISSLSLVTLSLSNALTVASEAGFGSLTIQNLVGLTGPGAMASLAAAGDGDDPPTTLVTITGSVSGPVELGAQGAMGTLDDQAASDPGETYVVVDDGELILGAQPSSQSVFQYLHSTLPAFNPPQTPAGIFAFDDPGAVVSAALTGLQAGDAIALPGSTVVSVAFGWDALRVTTNLGTTVFDNVSYAGGIPSGYTVSADPTGLLRIAINFGLVLLPVPNAGPVGDYQPQYTVYEPSYGAVIEGGNANVVISGTLGGAQVTLGNGADTIALGGYGNSVTLGDVTHTVIDAGAGGASVTIGEGRASITAGGWGDTFNLGGGAWVLGGWQGGATVTLSAGFGVGSALDFAGSAGDVFAQSSAGLTITSPDGAPFATVALPAGLGFTLAADGSGGTLLTGGAPPAASVVDFTGGPWGGSSIDTGAADGVVTLFGWNNTVTGADGDNTVSGSQGGTTIDLGNGDNTVSLWGWNNGVTLGDGDNTVTGPQGSTNVNVGSGDNSITLAGYGNEITAGGGTNVIIAGAGADQVHVGIGTDSIMLAGWSNMVTVGAGQESVSGGNAGLFEVTAAGSLGGLTVLDFGAAQDVLDVSALVGTVQVAASGADSLVSLVTPGGTAQVADLHGTGGASLAMLLAGHALVI